MQGTAEALDEDECRILVGALMQPSGGSAACGSGTAAAAPANSAAGAAAAAAASAPEWWRLLICMRPVAPLPLRGLDLSGHEVTDRVVQELVECGRGLSQDCELASLRLGRCQLSMGHPGELSRGNSSGGGRGDHW